MTKKSNSISTDFSRWIYFQSLHKELINNIIYSTVVNIITMTNVINLIRSTIQDCIESKVSSPRFNLRETSN